MIEYMFENAANKAAEVRSLDAEKKKIFIDGARWLVSYLEITLSKHPMEPDNCDFLERHRASQFRKALRHIKKIHKEINPPESAESE